MSNRDTCICGQPYNDHNVFKCMNGSIRNAPNEKKMSNEEFPISKKLGLKSIYKLEQGYGHYVFNGEAVFKAKDVEALLQSAQVVYGNISVNESVWFATPSTKGSDTHTALVVAITPIRKKTKAEAALELLGKLANDPAYYSSLGAAEAKQILEMKDEV